MANHKSSEKRIRQTVGKKESNKYYAKSMRTVLKEFRATTKKEDAAAKASKVNAMLDRLAKKHIIHANKAANLKSSVARHVKSL